MTSAGGSSASRLRFCPGGTRRLSLLPLQWPNGCAVAISMVQHNGIPIGTECRGQDVNVIIHDLLVRRDIPHSRIHARRTDQQALAIRTESRHVGEANIPSETRADRLAALHVPKLGG